MGLSCGTAGSCRRGFASLAGSFMLAVVAAHAAAQEIPVKPGEPVALVVWNREIVTLRAEINSVTPAERVERIRGRIEALPATEAAADVRVNSATIGSLSGVLVYAGDVQLFGLIPEDIDPESGLTVEQAGQRVKARLREVLLARAEQQKLPVLLKGVAFAVGATVLFVLLLALTVKARARALERLDRSRAARKLPVLGIDLYQFLSGAERFAVKLTAFSVWVVAAYVWLTYVLGLFPYSEPWGEGMAKFLRDLLAELGAGVLRSIPGLFTVLVIFLVTRIFTRMLGGVFQGVESGRLAVSWLAPDTARATRRLVILLVWVFALTAAYPYIPGSDTDAFKGISVLLGLMISLGSAGVVNQLMSGLVVVYSRALRPGEFVSVAGTEGMVSHVGMLSTKIVTRRREEVTIPNAVVTGHAVTNHSRLAGDDGPVITTTVTIGYDTPWRQVHALLELAAERTPGLRKTPRPAVLQRALSDFYVEYELRAHLERPELRPQALSDLHAQIQDAFNEFGVQIMSPHFEAQPESAVLVPTARWSPPPAGA